MTTPADRARRGRDARKRVPRSAHAVWIPSVDRPDPVALLERQGRDRLPELLPIRYGRMAASPFAFLRGSVAVMAADLASQPHTGLTVQLCGDPHLLNFGLYASPERTLLFDLNDFDETFPGPFEWDVKRLAASVAVAAQENGHPEPRVRRAALEAVAAYRTAMRRLSRLDELAVWYERIDAERLLPLLRSARHRGRDGASLTRARRRTSLLALHKLTEVVDGRRRIIHDPPLIEPAGASDSAALRKIFSDYRSTLAEDPDCCWSATASSTPPARSSASAASAPAVSSCCSPGATPTIRCSSRSRRPARPSWRNTCRTAPTSTPVTGWSPSNGCSRPPGTSSWAG